MPGNARRFIQVEQIRGSIRLAPALAAKTLPKTAPPGLSIGDKSSCPCRHAAGARTVFEIDGQENRISWRQGLTQRTWDGTTPAPIQRHRSTGSIQEGRTSTPILITRRDRLPRDPTLYRGHLLAASGPTRWLFGSKTAASISALFGGNGVEEGGKKKKKNARISSCVRQTTSWRALKVCIARLQPATKVIALRGACSRRQARRRSGRRQADARHPLREKQGSAPPQFPNNRCMPQTHDGHTTMLLRRGQALAGFGAHSPA